MKDLTDRRVKAEQVADKRGSERSSKRQLRLTVADAYAYSARAAPRGRMAFLHDPDGNTIMLHRRYAPV